MSALSVLIRLWELAAFALVLWVTVNAAYDGWIKLSGYAAARRAESFLRRRP